MKLFWVEINGYKRFGMKSKLNTQTKVIALVGPNESGKSTLINAINHIKSDKPMKIDGPNRELTRGVTITNDQSIITAGYLLENDDKNKISRFKGEKMLIGTS